MSNNLDSEPWPRQLQPCPDQSHPISRLKAVYDSLARIDRPSLALVWPVVAEEKQESFILDNCQHTRTPKRKGRRGGGKGKGRGAKGVR